MEMEWDEYVNLPVEERVRYDWEQQEKEHHSCMSWVKSKKDYNAIWADGRFTCQCGKHWQLANVHPGNYWEECGENIQDSI